MLLLLENGGAGKNCVFSKGTSGGSKELGFIFLGVEVQ